MSKVEVKYEEHMSPGDLDQLMSGIQDQGVYATPSMCTLVHLRRYRQILIDAYNQANLDTEAEFWGGKPKYLKKGILS